MKLFVLLPRVPYPIEKGDKLRAYHQLRHLAEKHEIILCALSDEEIHPDAFSELKKIVSELHIIKLTKFGSACNIVKAFFNGKPLQVGYYYNKKAHKQIKKLIEKYQPDHIYAQLVRVAEYVKKQQVSTTIDYQDVFSKNIYRRAQTEAWYKKPVFYLEAARLKRYERKVFDCFDNKTIIAEPDRVWIDHKDREQIHIIGNGVDMDFFKPIKIEKKYDLVFIGNMSYAPNVDSAEYLANEIIPEIHKTNPEITLTLAGASPLPRVKALATDKIKVTGWVDDIRESYAAAKIFIAPMNIGTGLQNKLLEAMAMGIPCITSVLANDSLNAIPEKDVLIGTTKQDYAQYVISLLNNPEKAKNLAKNGAAFVNKNFDWSAATSKLEKIMSTKR
ncbi:MAG: glycosyltransferase [Bacteroidota bacterium]|nr:glycosyltransferase [Bacteroidota bacterium]